MSSIKDRELTLEEIHVASLGVMKRLHDFCEEHKINYSIMYGTLLGAIRHGGFIPWDDDVDVAMLRPEYDRFVELCIKNENVLYPYKLISKETNSLYPYNIPRFCDTRFRMVKTDGLEDAGMGLFIDIYPLDGISDIKQFEKRMKKKKNLWMRCLGCAYSKSVLSADKKIIHSVLRFPFWVYAKSKGADYFLSKFDDEVRKCDFDSSEYVGLVQWDYDVITWKKEWFEELREIPFEDIRVKAPVVANTVLEYQYGDYMKLPPVEKRVPYHEYLIYRK